MYAINQKLNELIEKAHGGVGLRHVTKGKFEETEIALPPFAEQLRLVQKMDALLSELDSGVASLIAARQQLNVYRQAVLKRAFEGKLTAEWREEHRDKLDTPDHLLERVKRDREETYRQLVREWETRRRNNGGRPRPLKAYSALGAGDLERLPVAPEQWCWARLGLMTCGVEYGTAAKSSQSGKVPVIRMGNIQNAKLDWSDLVYTSDDAEIRKYALSEGDVLFNRTNSPELVGKTAIYRGERPAVFAGYLIRINHIPSIADGQYLNLFLNSHVARQHGNGVKTDGVNQSNINGEKLSNYPFPYCSLAEQREIVRLLDEKLSLIDQMEHDIEEQFQKSDVLRQSILKKAFSGQLVPQDANDEPASALLERIKAEKETNNKNKNGRKAAA